MDLRGVREALRVLRLESGLSLDGIPGLDRATVHRIENIRNDPDYAPRITSVALIVEACGCSLAQFFMEYEGAEAALSQRDPGVLSQLTDEETLLQVRAFLRLQANLRQLLAEAPHPTPGQAQPPTDGPTRGHAAATPPTPRRATRRPRPASRKTGT